jgi:hypothetical protein
VDQVVVIHLVKIRVKNGFLAFRRKIKTNKQNCSKASEKAQNSMKKTGFFISPDFAGFQKKFLCNE